MQTSLLADDDLPDAASLVAAQAVPASPRVFDEWCGTGPDVDGGVAPGIATVRRPGEPAPHWRQFFNSLGTAGWQDLAARRARVGNRVREDGATYNVYADGDASARPWPLELLPTIIAADDWAEIELGVAQRARLLEATLVDIYGPQQLLRDALLPASLIYAHPQYLRAARGLLGPEVQRLHVVAFDLARSSDGAFRMLAQRVQAPSGLGYVLENRMIIGAQFPDQFGELHVQRLASSFRLLLDGLMRASPAGAHSRVVLLTPGPRNETYFEQVFLARYLGIALVEGSDLTVRGQHLFLKTLSGLEPVHVVLRRVDDEFLDPLELRSDSALGVPGLLQALRAGHVVLANAPGAGVLESPGLTAFWPALSRRLLGEELLLPASTSWWCGEQAVWQAQQGKLADFVVAPTFQDSGFGPRVVAALPAKARASLRERIEADPAAYTLQARVRPSQTPVWSDGRLEPRTAVLRVFAVSDGQGGWRVLPGALTRVATRSPRAGEPMSQDPWLSMQHGSASTDTWVITEDRVDEDTMLPAPLTAADLQQWHRSVTSRAAENLFWLGRYTERSENAVRLVTLTLEALSDASAPVLGFMADLARFHGLVDEAVPTPDKAPRVFERALIDSLRGETAAASVGHSLRSLRRCAQTLRERLSPEHWRLITEVDAHFEEHLAAVLAQGEGHVLAPDVLGVLSRAATHLSAITGAQTDRMMRDHGWRLLSVGRQIERLDTLSHALAQGFEQRVHEADDGFALLLGLFDSLISYRAQFQARREVLPLLHLVVADTDNTRSLAWVARAMRDRLRKLARHDEAWASQVTAELSMPETWDLELLATPDADGRHSALIQHLEACSAQARALSDEISRRLFAHVASPERRVSQ